jgi:hypothetical protein
VIASAKATPGQVVQAQDILFQIVDPKGYWVEALVYGQVDPQTLNEATAIATGGQSIALAFRGFSPRFSSTLQSFSSRSRIPPLG